MSLAPRLDIDTAPVFDWSDAASCDMMANIGNRREKGQFLGIKNW